MGDHIKFLAEWGYTGPISWGSEIDVELVVEQLQRIGRDIWRNPHVDHSWALAVARSATVTGLVREAIGNNIAIENTFLISKHPGASFEVPAHQDGIDEYLELDPQRSMSAWFALSDAPLDAGCLWVSPGTHYRGYRDFSSKPLPGSIDARGNPTHLSVREDIGKFVAVPICAGEAIVFNSALIHKSESNRSPRSRWGLNVRYVAPGAVIRRHPERPALVPV